MAAAGAGGSEARLGGTLRPDDRRGEEVRRVEHPGPGRLERGAPARGSGAGRYEFVVQPMLAGHG